MSMDINELAAESAELLPGREALGKLKFNFTKTVTVTKHVANVDASNTAHAANYGSDYSTVAADAGQSITISQ